MTSHPNIRGGASVAVLSALDGWESNLVMNLRLWCEGPVGQAQVWTDYALGCPSGKAQSEVQAFEALLNTLMQHCKRPFVRHSVGCPCVGSDECVFVTLVKTASEGHLEDAALIATLMAHPAFAEQIALLAGQVGEGARHLVRSRSETSSTGGADVVRLH